MVGEPAPYDELPWFWSDQYDLNIQMFGVCATDARIVWRGAPGEARSLAFALEAGRMTMAVGFNAAADLLVLIGELRGGDFYTGERTRVVTQLAVRPNRHFRAAMDYEYNDVTLPQGDFIVRLARLTLETAFSSTLSWVNLIQYDNVSETVGVNSRLHWVPEAGREGFLVINHNLEDFDRDNEFHSTFSEATVKFGYTFRF